MKKIILTVYASVANVVNANGTKKSPQMKDTVLTERIKMPETLRNNNDEEVRDWNFT